MRRDKVLKVFEHLKKRKVECAPEFLFYEPVTNQFYEEPPNDGSYYICVLDRPGMLTFKVLSIKNKLEPQQVIGRGANGAVCRGNRYPRPGLEPGEPIYLKWIEKEQSQIGDASKEMRANFVLGMGRQPHTLQKHDQHRAYLFQVIENRGEKITQEKIDTLSLDEQLQACISFLREFAMMHSGLMAAKTSSSSAVCPYVHRDINSTNILMREDTNGKIEIKAIDFGDAVPYTGQEKQEGYFGTLEYLPVSGKQLLSYYEASKTERNVEDDEESSAQLEKRKLRLELLKAAIGIDSMLADKIACLRTIIHPVHLAGGSLVHSSHEGGEVGTSYLLSPENFNSLPECLRDLLDTRMMDPKTNPKINLIYIASVLATYRLCADYVVPLHLAIIKASPLVQRQILTIMENFNSNTSSQQSYQDEIAKLLRNEFHAYYERLIKQPGLKKAKAFCEAFAQKKESLLPLRISVAFLSVVECCPELGFEHLKWLETEKKVVNNIVVASFENGQDKHEVLTQQVQLARYGFALKELEDFIGQLDMQHFDNQARKLLSQQLLLITDKRYKYDRNEFGVMDLPQALEYIEICFGDVHELMLKQDVEPAKKQGLIKQLHQIQADVFPDTYHPYDIMISRHN